MKFVNEIPNPSGAYQGPHKAPFPGCLPLTDGQAETLEAWEAWKAAQPPEPEPEPTLDERVAGIEAAVQEGLRLYEGDLSNG